jgi:hypothetical protein
VFLTARRILQNSLPHILYIDVVAIPIPMIFRELPFLYFGGEAISFWTEIFLKTGDCFAPIKAFGMVSGRTKTLLAHLSRRLYGNDIYTVEKYITKNQSIKLAFGDASSRSRSAPK